MTRRELLLGAVAMAAEAREDVVMDHDGGFPDDYLALALLLAMPRYRLTGVVVTPADSFGTPAVSATRKLLGAAGQGTVETALSASAGVHPFPEEWRKMSHKIDEMPLFRGVRRAPFSDAGGAEFLVAKLARPAVLLVTGPLSTVAAALDRAPAIEKNIRKIVWMGGALRVPGNVKDSPAEWNVYWDALGAARVWRSKLPVVMCPLDVTNQTPVKRDFIDALGREKSLFARLAHECYSQVVHAGEEYYFWDVLTAAYLGNPELFQSEELETAIVVGGKEDGRTVIRAGGRRTTVLTKVDAAGFYSYVEELWRR